MVSPFSLRFGSNFKRFKAFWGSRYLLDTFPRARMMLLSASFTSELFASRWPQVG